MVRRRDVVGLTVVGFGTSAPEMLVSAMAALALGGRLLGLAMEATGLAERAARCAATMRRATDSPSPAPGATSDLRR